MTRPPRKPIKSFDAEVAVAADIASSRPPADDGYRVGPGRPPREYQFKPGQSGNPRGAKRKSQSIARDLKAILNRELNAKVPVKQGDKLMTMTMAEAGIKQLVAQYAKGDRHARRDRVNRTDVGLERTFSSTPMPARTMSTRVSPATLPCLIRSSTSSESIMTRP